MEDDLKPIVPVVYNRWNRPVSTGAHRFHEAKRLVDPTKHVDPIARIKEMLEAGIRLDRARTAAYYEYPDGKVPEGAKVLPNLKTHDLIDVSRQLAEVNAKYMSYKRSKEAADKEKAEAAAAAAEAERDRIALEKAEAKLRDRDRNKGAAP